MRRNTLAALMLAACVVRAQSLWITADSDSPAPAARAVYRGEVIPIEASLRVSGGWAALAGADARFFWQTNGMGSSWWSAPASVVAGLPDRARYVWHPTNDCGAATYSFFFRLAPTNGAVVWRANGILQMRGSPGFSPAAMPPPSAYPTLAADLLPLLLPSVPTYAAWTNEAALRAAGDLAGSNHVYAVRTNLQAQIDNINLTGSSTGAVSAASSADTALRLASADTNWWVSVSCGTATLWRAYATNRWIVTAAGTPIQNGAWDVASPPALFTNAGRWTVSGYSGGYVTNSSVAVSVNITVPWNNYYATQQPAGLTFYNLTSGVGTTGTVTLHRVTAVTNRVGDYVTAADLASALAAYNPSAATNALALASNAMAVAQAAATQASLIAATNAIVQRYFVSSNAWITADFSNETVSVSLVTAGRTNTVEVGGGESIDPAATNLLWQALAQGLASKADKSWGQYSPAGQPNPDPEYMLWLSSPATFFASGAEWSSSGSYAVLTTPGMVAYESGSNGVFRIAADATNWFGIVSGGSVLVGARPGAITVHGGGTEGGYAEITFDYDGGEFPTLWFAPSLRVDFAVVGSAVWTDNMDGSATVSAPATTAAGFWRATTSASYDRAFECTMPARFSGGLIAATNSAPVVYDSVIQIQSGGKTYRVPAQEVQ